MKFYIIIIYISIYTYKSNLCNSYKSCYNCSTSIFNCRWFKNECLNFNVTNESYINNNISSYLSFPFINKQYRCINNEKDIEIFEEINNKNIILYKQNDGVDEIKYNVYCLKYKIFSSIRLKFNFNNEYFNNNILELSIYDNITKTEKIINNSMNNNIFNINSNFICIKITYVINSTSSNIFFSFSINKYDIINSNTNTNNSQNLASFIILIVLLLFITFILSFFIFWHKNVSEKNRMKEIVIINNPQKNNNVMESKYSKNDESLEQSNINKSQCSELQEKYLELSKDNIVENNYETIESFVKSIHDKEKKNVYLKAIIKTLPFFIITKKNNEFIGIFCAFCENKMKLNDKICFITCGHVFHYDCICQQIITNEEYKCIICRESIII